MSFPKLKNNFVFRPRYCSVTHTHTHARTHARTHAHTHTHMQRHTHVRERTLTQIIYIYKFTRSDNTSSDNCHGDASGFAANVPDTGSDRVASQFWCVFPNLPSADNRWQLSWNSPTFRDLRQTSHFPQSFQEKRHLSVLKLFQIIKTVQTLSIAFFLYFPRRWGWGGRS